jgi:hypothetical protein
VENFDRLSAHALRVGFITAAYENGVRDEDIMRHTRHRDLRTMRGYVQRAGLVSESPAGIADGTSTARVLVDGLTGQYRSLRSLAIVASRMRYALSGVGTVSHRARSHCGHRSSSRASIAGKYRQSCSRRRFVRRLRSAPRSSAMRDHSRNSMTTAATATTRKQRGSVRKGGGHHLGVTAVILGACQRKRSRKRSHLFRVDGVNLEAALDQCLDHGAVRDLNCNMDLAGLGNAARCHQPSRHLGKSFATMLEDFSPIL